MVDHILTGNKQSSEMITYLVTGSHGHIGSYVVEELVKTKNNIRVVCIDNHYNSNLNNLKSSYSFAKQNNNQLIEISADISNEGLMREIFIRDQPTYVFHCASYLTLDSKQFKARATQVNTYASALIFDLSLQYGVKKVVYSSSASVYGNPIDIPTTEEHPFEFRLFYGATKAATENIATSFMVEEGLPIVGLRYFNVYGPRQSLSNVYTQIVPKWIRSIAIGDPITVYGDGEQTMDMIFGSDIGRANIAAMDNLECKNMFLNVATGIETSVNDLLNIIIDEMKILVPKAKIEVLKEEHDPNLVKRRCADVSKMHQYLGKHQIEVREGIKLTCKELYDKVDHISHNQ